MSRLAVRVGAHTTAVGDNHDGHQRPEQSARGGRRPNTFSGVTWTRCGSEGLKHHCLCTGTAGCPDVAEHGHEGTSSGARAQCRRPLIALPSAACRPDPTLAQDSTEQACWSRNAEEKKSVTKPVQLDATKDE